MSVEQSRPQITRDENSSSQPLWPAWSSELLSSRALAEFAGYWLASYGTLAISGFEYHGTLAAGIALTLVYSRRSFFHQRSSALVIGAGQEAERVRRYIAANSKSGLLHVNGFVPLSGEEAFVPQGSIMVNDDFYTLLRASRSKLLIIAPDGTLSSAEVQQILDCKLKGVKLICASSLK